MIIWYSTSTSHRLSFIKNSFFLQNCSIWHLWMSRNVTRQTSEMKSNSKKKVDTFRICIVCHEQMWEIKFSNTCANIWKAEHSHWYSKINHRLIFFKKYFSLSNGPKSLSACKSTWIYLQDLLGSRIRQVNSPRRHIATSSKKDSVMLGKGDDKGGGIGGYTHKYSCESDYLPLLPPALSKSG